jgi:Zn-dependent M16 (insulinase) family peptidase
MMAASSGMSPGAALKHRLGGLAGIRQTKAFHDSLSIDGNLDAFTQKLAQLHQYLMESPRRFLLISEPDTEQQLLEPLQNLWGKDIVTAAGHGAFSLPPVQQQVKQAWITSTPVNFCAKAFPAVPMEHEDAPALAVLAGFLRNGNLHREIRERGGAYGGGASFQAENAVFRFYSYRDPRLQETLDDFDRSIHWLLNEKHEWSQLEEAIMGVISAIDKPTSPAGEAKDAYVNALYGRTPEKRQKYRARVLDVTLEDLQRVGKTYFDQSKASVAVITNASHADPLREQQFEVINL